MSTKTKRHSKKRHKRKSKKYINKRVLVIIVTIFAIALAGLIAYASLNAQKAVQAKKIDFGKPVACGVDVSSHNGRVDFEKLKEDCDFVIVRVGYRGYANGEIAIDKNAKNNLRLANKAGIPVGVYFYSQAITPAEAEKEAKFVLKVIRGYDVALPVFYDFEYASGKKGNTGRLYDAKLSAKESTELVNSFCTTVKAAGYKYGVYASSSVYKWQLKPKKFIDDTYIWIADYNKKLGYNGDYDIWQYSKKGKSDAVKSKYIDQNYWYKKE